MPSGAYISLTILGSDLAFIAHSEIKILPLSMIVYYVCKNNAGPGARVAVLQS